MSDTAPAGAAGAWPETREALAAALLRLATLLAPGRRLHPDALAVLFGDPPAEVWGALLDAVTEDGLLARGEAGLYLPADRARQEPLEREAYAGQSVLWITNATGLLEDAPRLFALHQRAPQAVAEVAALAGELLAQLPLRVVVNTPGMRPRKRLLQQLPLLLQHAGTAATADVFYQQAHLRATAAQLERLAASAREQLALLNVPYLSVLWQTGADGGGKGSGHASAIADIALAVDAGFAASVDAAGQTHIWSLATGQLHHTFSGPPQGARRVLITGPDQLVTAYEDGTVRFLQLPEKVVRQLLAELPAAAADGVTETRLFATNDAGDLSAYDPGKRQPLFSAALGASLTALAAAPGGLHLLGGTAGGALHAWRYHEPSQPA